MKKILYSLFLVPMLFAGCSEKEEIVFDHEKPAFDTQADRILLEVIPPTSTLADEEIYISGAFNGGDEAAMSDSKWMLTHSETIDKKWGIYLNPADFINGKTLADGYHFVSKKGREERTALNEEVVRTLNPAPGSRTNLYVTLWASYFDVAQEDEEVEHDGYAVFVVNETGWDEIALYIWGTGEICGGWPGMAPTGTQVKAGVKYTYWDLGKANTGNDCNFIFNNNNNGVQLENFDCLKGQKLDRDYYFILTADGVEETSPEPVVEHDGFAVFAQNTTGWDEISLYIWGTGEICGGWPGMAPTGTQTIKGTEFVYWDLGEANTGNDCNFIFNNNNNGIQLENFDCLKGQKLDKDYYFVLTPDNASVFGAEEGTDPDTPVDPEEPEDPGEPVMKTYNVYVQDNSDWSVFNVYSWGGSPNVEAFGGWPGSAGEAITINGEPWRVYTTIELEEGSEYHLIFNNKVGDGDAQYDAIAGTWDGDLYISASATEAAAAEAPKNYKLYVIDNTGWAGLSIYAWGGDPNVESFGGWSGASATEETIDEITYKVFTTVDIEPGTEFHMIPNDKGHGGDTQYDGLVGNWTRDIWCEVGASEMKEIAPAK